MPPLTTAAFEDENARCVCVAQTNKEVLEGITAQARMMWHSCERQRNTTQAAFNRLRAQDRADQTGDDGIKDTRHRLLDAMEAQIQKMTELKGVLVILQAQSSEQNVALSGPWVQPPPPPSPKPDDKNTFAEKQQRGGKKRKRA